MTYFNTNSLTGHALIQAERQAVYRGVQERAGSVYVVVSTITRLKIQLDKEND